MTGKKALVLYKRIVDYDLSLLKLIKDKLVDVFKDIYLCDDYYEYLDKAKDCGKDTKLTANEFKKLKEWLDEEE